MCQCGTVFNLRDIAFGAIDVFLERNCTRLSGYTPTHPQGRLDYSLMNLTH